LDDLTLDVCVLMSGSNIGNPQFRQICFDLMKRMLSNDNYKLALDGKCQISHQYLEKNKQGTFGHHFVIQMMLKEKTVMIPWRKINDAIRVKLEERGFTRNNEDYKYIICASRTTSNKLVSHEPHFFNVRQILKRIPVEVLLPNQP